jgi:hypothetical protein
MGIVHRDLKPDNIMLAKNRDGSDCVKVVDFGIAKAADNEAQKVTKTGLVVGTPEYMSPEQLAGDKLDGRSDTYSLALVAFAMFTGKLPFPAETVQESMILRLTEQPRRLHEMKNDVQWPPAVQEVMDKALERDAALRYQSAAEFGRALHKAVMSMPEAAMTNAFTSVIGRMSTPKAPAAIPGPPRQSAGATRPMPATRVNPATPAGSPVVEPPTAVRPEKSRTGVYAGIGGVAVLAVAGFFVMNSLKDKGNVQANDNGAAGTTTAAVAPPVTPISNPAQPIDVDAELEKIAELTNLELDAAVGRAQAAEALRRLDDLPPAVRLTNEQRVQAALLRAEANIHRDSTCLARKAIQQVEGPSRGTKFEKRVDFLLQNSTCTK